MQFVQVAAGVAAAALLCVVAVSAEELDLQGAAVARAGREHARRDHRTRFGDGDAERPQPARSRHVRRHADRGDHRAAAPRAARGSRPGDVRPHRHEGDERHGHRHVHADAPNRPKPSSSGGSTCKSTARRRPTATCGAGSCRRASGLCFVQALLWPRRHENTKTNSSLLIFMPSWLGALSRST